MRHIATKSILLAAMIIFTGITSYTYGSDNIEKTCKSLRNEMELFLPLLEEFKLDDKEEFSDNDLIRCFAASSSPGILSHFIIVIEKDDVNTIMHMAGEIKSDDFN